jgi:UDPglucose 6-dehydrogenase
MLVDIVSQHAQPGARIAVLGLSYKPSTAVVEESASLYLIRDLLDRGFAVSAYDPMGMNNARQELTATVSFAATLDEAVKEADVIVVATAWKEFRSLSYKSLLRAATNGTSTKVTIIDCWRILDAREYEDVAQLVYLGVGPTSGRNGTALPIVTEERTI